MLDFPALPPRVIPSLLLQGDIFVKTKNFKKPVYIGDPINTINVFNSFEVDEIIILDIGCTLHNKAPNFSLIFALATESWVPLAYGGGIRSVADAKRILNSGIEKVIFNNLLFTDSDTVKDCVHAFGSSSVVACITVKQSVFGYYHVIAYAGRRKMRFALDNVLDDIQKLGVGELVINDLSREGTRRGYDTQLISRITRRLDIPVIAMGGAGSLEDFKMAVDSGADAAAAGSYFVFYKEGSGVLIHYPDRKVLERVFHAG
jgi:imidazole glycerol-phosphate synthase subunit HisF